MDLLLDTCALIYLCQNHSGFTSRAKQAVLDPENRCLVSIASVWEMGIKLSLGKIKFDLPVDEFIEYHAKAYSLEILPIEIAHIVKISQFQEAHKDPFDRLIIATGLVRSIPIVTADPRFVGFGVEVIW